MNSNSVQVNALFTVDNLGPSVPQIPPIPDNISTKSSTVIRKNYSSAIENVNKRLKLDSPTVKSRNILKQITSANISSSKYLVTVEDLEETKEDIKEYVKKLFDERLPKAQEVLNSPVRNETAEVLKITQEASKTLKLIEENVEMIKVLSKSNKPSEEIKNIITLGVFKERHKLELPFPSREKFLIFDNDLKQNANDITVDLFKYLTTLEINRDKDVRDELLKIMKIFFSRVSLEKYVGSKNVTGKFLFKDTSFYQILEDTFLKVYNNPNQDKENPVPGNVIKPIRLESKLILKAIGSIITSSKDWDGGRKLREQQQLIEGNKDAEQK